MSFESFVVALLLLIVALLAALLYQGWRRSEALGSATEIEELLQSEGNRLFGQIEAYLSLRDRLDLRHGLPYNRHWSAAPDFLKLIVEHALGEKPSTILECGSGLTSLMLARCCEINGKGALFSLENGAEYAEKTRAEIARYGLESRAIVTHAPLVEHMLSARGYQWYALDGVPERSIDMLVIDGPPGFIQRHSRYPALPLLFDKLADGCVVFMDDAARQDEREIVAMWQAEFKGVEHEYIGTERGCSVLRIRR